MVDLWCQSYPRPPKAITLDFDDTADTVHGHQQLSLFNAFYDERCFMPPHVYDAASGHCVLTILRPGKTPDGREVRAHIRRLVRRIRQHWPNTVITSAADAFRHIGSLRDPIRGDSHYGRWEAMDWCEQNGVQYVFGLERNKVLEGLVQAEAEALERRWAAAPGEGMRAYTETRYAAGTWSRQRRVVARVEATYQGLDTRYVVTNIGHCGAQWLYDGLYCARGQAENLIKRHKSQLASERTSCRSPLANQMRLILHTAAYWLMRLLRDAIPRPQPLASGAFSTIRLRLLKIAVR
ncbi:MAG: IS1380 family transposase, partial [Acetobacteraceae bacterium]|nr:IS1380 family transposase [Acetobacteraceae bacterium]